VDEYSIRKYYCKRYKILELEHVSDDTLMYSSGSDPVEMKLLGEWLLKNSFSSMF
jgi:hypothetical protein